MKPLFNTNPAEMLRRIILLSQGKDLEFDLKKGDPNSGYSIVANKEGGTEVSKTMDILEKIAVVMATQQATAAKGLNANLYSPTFLQGNVSQINPKDKLLND